MLNDFRYLIRSLLRSPGYTSVVIGTLMLGIGANLTLFLLVNVVLFQPLPYGDDHQLAMLWTPPTDVKPQSEDLVISYPDFVDWQHRSKSFTGIAAYNIAVADLTGGDAPENLPGAFVTPNFFSVLEVRPVLGRGLDTTQPGERAVVISFDLWQRRFAGQRSIIGEKLSLSGYPYSVIGVLPQNFEQPEPFWNQKAQFWVTIPASYTHLPRNGRFLRAIGRLHPGISVRTAQSEMSAIALEIGKEFPQTNRNRTIEVVSLRDQLYEGSYRALLLLFLGSLSLLIIACANVSNLQIARTIYRSKEMLIRSALGAGRLKLACWIYGESLLLALGGALAGVVCAIIVKQALFPRLTKQFAIAGHAELDYRLGLWVLVLVFALASLIAIVPTSRLLMMKLSSLFHFESDKQSAPFWRKLRGLLVTAQVSMVLPVLFVCLLLVQSAVRLSQIDPGFRSERLITFRISLPDDRYPNASRLNQFSSDLMRDLNGIPGVKSVAISSMLPMTVLNSHFLRGVKLMGDAVAQSAYYRVVSDRYFQTMGIAQLEGRPFMEGDGEPGRTAVIVNQSFVQNYCKGISPVGRRTQIQDLQRDGGWASVVGVVSDVRFDGPSAPPAPEIYAPYAQDPWPDIAVVVNTTVSSDSVLPAIRKTLSNRDPLLPLTDVESMADIVSDSTARIRLSTLVVLLSATLSLALALIGVSGVVAYLAATKQKDFAIRIALGAQATDILRQTIKHTFKFVFVGCLLGLVAALGASRLLKALLDEISPGSVVGLITVTAVVCLTALPACYFPARRILEIQPSSLMRSE